MTCSNALPDSAGIQAINVFLYGFYTKENKIHIAGDADRAKVKANTAWQSQHGNNFHFQAAFGCSFLHC
jgi:hypothetical protein